MSLSNRSNESLTGITTQSKCFNPVIRSGGCAANEWACDSRGNSDVVCSKIDLSVCPSLENYTISGEFMNNSRVPGERSVSVKCTYTQQNPNNNGYDARQVLAFKSAFGANESWRKVIMPGFCSVPGQRDNCNINPETGRGFASCSRFTTTDESGLLCRDYVKVAPADAAIVQRNYCKTNHTPDCLCLNREEDETFLHIRNEIRKETSLGNIADEAWYAPCRDPVHYVITSELADMATAATIPACGEFNNIEAVRRGKISPQKYDASVDCVGNKDPNENPPQGRSESGRLLDDFSYIIFAIIIVIIIVIIVGFIGRVIDQRRNNIKAAHILAIK